MTFEIMWEGEESTNLSQMKAGGSPLSPRPLDYYVDGGLPPSSPELAIVHDKARRLRDRAFFLPDLLSLIGECLDDFIRHFLGIAKKHHRAVLVKQRIIDASVA